MLDIFLNGRPFKGSSTGMKFGEIHQRWESSQLYTPPVNSLEYVVAPGSQDFRLYASVENQSEKCRVGKVFKRETGSQLK